MVPSDQVGIWRTSRKKSRCGSLRKKRLEESRESGGHEHAREETPEEAEEKKKKTILLALGKETTANVCHQ